MRLLIGDERHRGDLTGPVATLAVVLQDGEDVFVKSGWLLLVLSKSIGEGQPH